MNVTQHFRRLIITATSIAAVLGVLWWCVWTLAVLEYQQVIDHIIESVRAEGYQISYDDRRAFGFPHRIALRLSNLHWKNSDNIEFHTNDIDISSVPWMWREFDAHFKGGATLEAPLEADGQALHLSGEQGRAHVELDKDHLWKVGRILLLDAKVGKSPTTLFSVHHLEFNANRPLVPPSSHAEAGLTLSGQANDIDLPPTMPTPFGSKVDSVEFALRIMGAVPDVRRKSDVEAWNKESGIIEFDKLDFKWGPLLLKARGTMGFDDDLQPEGAFSGAIIGHEAAMKALLDAGYIAPRQAGMLNSALELFAHVSDKDGTPGIELPITVQLGGLFLGPVRIFMFPEIMWQQGDAK